MRLHLHRRPPVVRPALMLAVAAAFLPVSTSAQTVVGTVMEAGTARPLAGAFVTLETLDGARQGGVLAGDEGRFVIRAPTPGTYRLVARFIGYADAVSDAFTLGDGETVRRAVEVSVRAVSLEGIRAEVGKRCRLRPGAGPETARLWEEARKALEIADWTEDEGALRLRIMEHKRELDATSLRVIAIREEGRRGWYDESPYRSIPADSLHAGGYIQPVGDGLWDYWAPDAEVLLSESFLDTHCFRVAESLERPDAVGLAFEPVPGRTLPDIEGVLWLDRATAELRTLDYAYVNAPDQLGDWDQVGGRVEFQRLATGMWIVNRWHVRMPLEVTYEGGYDTNRARRSLVSLVEDGAEVVDVRTASGEVLARATGATLYGVVEDSATGGPMEGAAVALVATGRETTTGPDGAYRLDGLPAGTFGVRVTHPDLELLGGEPLERQVSLERGRAVRLTVRPSLADRAASFCAGAGPLEDPAVLFGRVRAPDAGTPVPGALVRVFAGGAEERVVADSTGAFALCLERGDPVELIAVGPADTFRDRQALDTRSVTLDGPLARQDLVLDPAVLAARPSPDARPPWQGWSNALIGTVVRHDTRAPIAGAMVLVRDADGRPIHSAVTNDDGQFRFQHPDPHTRQFELTVEHVAYGRVSRVVDFAPGEQLDVEVVLTERAIELDPIVVTQRRRGLLVDVGFYDRLERGAGLFIQRDEIDRRHPSRVTDMMQGKPGVTVVQTSGVTRDIRVIAPVTFGDCQPALWLDGSLVRAGGTPRTGANGQPTQPQLSELVSPEEIEAIEIYKGPAGMPAQYRTSESSCGVVVIWTRRGGM